MKNAIVALALVALLLPGCYVNYHHRYFARLYRERHPLLIWIAMYGTPVVLDYDEETVGMTGATCSWHLPDTWVCQPADTGGWDCQVGVN